MAYYTHQTSRRDLGFGAIWLASSFPVVCFTLALAADLAYWRTENLLWLHFSEWLLFAGLAVGVLALLLGGIGRLVNRSYPSWPTLGLGTAVLILAAINSFVHTADGWTAVVPWGLALSVATVVAMAITWWVASAGGRV